MKKILSLTLALLMMLFAAVTLVSCNGGDDDKSELPDADGSFPVTGVLVVRRAFAEEHPEAVARLLADYEASINFAKQNPSLVAPMVETHVGIKANVAKVAIPACNLTYIDGADMKATLSPFLSVLHAMEPTSVGGKLPDSDFYYTGTAEPSDTATTVRMGVMTGPTGIGAAKMMNDAEGKSTYAFTVKGNAKELTPMLLQGTLDAAAIPSNLAATLYNNSDGKIAVVAINTLSVVSILEKGDTIASIADLKGKTIYATGKGAVPEYTIRYLLKKAGLDPDKDVTFEWKTEPQEVLQYLKTTDGAVAMMPQPFVTQACAAVDGLKIVLDLNDEWTK